MASEAAEALLAEIASLEASWSELAAAVAAASRDLAEGRPPAAGLEAALAEARRAYPPISGSSRRWPSSRELPARRACRPSEGRSRSPGAGTP
jgi:hypothetical protein